MSRISTHVCACLLFIFTPVMAGAQDAVDTKNLTVSTQQIKSFREASRKPWCTEKDPRSGDFGNDCTIGQNSKLVIGYMGDNGVIYPLRVIPVDGAPQFASNALDDRAYISGVLDWIIKVGQKAACGTTCAKKAGSGACIAACLTTNYACDSGDISKKDDPGVCTQIPGG